MQVCRGLKLVHEFLHHTPYILRRVSPFQTYKLRRDTLASLQGIFGNPALVDQKITLTGLIGKEPSRLRDQQIGHIPNRVPRSASVVQNKGEHRRQTVLFIDGSGFDQVLPEQSRVGQYPHGHPRVFPALELQDKQDIRPGILPAHPPDHIVASLPQVVAHIIAGAAFQRGKIQIGDEILSHEIPQQGFHHLAVAEKLFIGRIVRRMIITHGFRITGYLRSGKNTVWLMRVQELSCYNANFYKNKLYITNHIQFQ